MTTVAFSTPGFAELLVLAVLGLLIFGPERLPGMARNAGRMIARFKAEASGTLEELKRAAELDELRGVADELRHVGSDLRSSGTDLQRVGADLTRSVTAQPGAPAQTGSASEEPPFDPDAT